MPVHSAVLHRYSHREDIHEPILATLVIIPAEWPVEQIDLEAEAETLYHLLNNNLPSGTVNRLRDKLIVRGHANAKGTYLPTLVQAHQPCQDYRDHDHHRQHRRRRMLAPGATPGSKHPAGVSCRQGESVMKEPSEQYVILDTLSQLARRLRAQVHFPQQLHKYRVMYRSHKNSKYTTAIVEAFDKSDARFRIKHLYPKAYVKEIHFVPRG